MWFFMILCYLLNAISFLLLFIAGLQGYFLFPVGALNHITFSLVTIVFYLFSETLVMFFFVGTGISVKEYVQLHDLNPEFHQRTIRIKRQLYPPLLLNIFLVTSTFIIGGAVHTKLIPSWIHGILFIIALGHFAKSIWVQHNCFRENTAVVIEMCDVAHPTKEMST